MTSVWRLSFRAERRRRDGSTFSLVADVSADAPRLVVVGPSGSGKTTLVDAVSGHVPVDGRIEVGGHVLDEAAGTRIPPHERRLGWVDQDARLFPHLNVLENVAFGSPPTAAVPPAAWLERVGGASWARRRPDELSGGQRQRVVVARAFASQPRALMLDEPLAALDPAARGDMFRLIDSLAAEARLPWLWVTHDASEALAAGEAAIVVRDGAARSVDGSGERGTNPADEDTLRPLTRWRGRCLGESEDGLARVSFGSAELVVAARDVPRGAPVVCELDADDVVLARGARPQTSARNRLTGRIASIAPSGSRILCTVEAPAPLRVRITERSRRELDLAPGTEVHLLFKVSAVRVRYVASARR